jgi:hypothetical protein
VIGSSHSPFKAGLAGESIYRRFDAMLRRIVKIGLSLAVILMVVGGLAAYMFRGLMGDKKRGRNAENDS